MSGTGSSSNESPSPRNEVVLEAQQTRQYLIAPWPGSVARGISVQPMSAVLLNAAVDQMGLDIVRRIKRPLSTLATFGAGQGEATDVLVANIEPERAQLLAATAPQLSIGENSTLSYGGSVGPVQKLSLLGMLTGLLPKKIAFRILGSSDKPLADATVTLAGDSVPVQAQTNKNGEVTLDLYTLQDRPARTLFVTTKSDYWDHYLTEPQLSDSAINVIRLRAYSETIDGFPQGFRYGWGQRLMGLDRLAAGLTGQGVKIAIIDSGADNTHPLLSHIQIGRDVSGSGDSTTWNKDLVGHGSHCAGVIAARSDLQLRGFAPEAEIHILKVFPGGRYDSLIDALDYCIDHRIDVVNMSLGGGPEINPAVEDTLTAAALNGIACIVAAGNSGDAVQYPARSPSVLAVAAIGDMQEVQPNTWDSSTFQAQFVAADGVFSPAFTCHGTEIAVCAPGVAIISTVPGGGFEAESGTSMAAPHITGLAALLLAHHPIFRTKLQARNQARVAGLFGIIKSLCTPYPFGTDRAGAGLPKFNALGAFLQPTGESAQAPSAGGPGLAPTPILTPQGAIGGVLVPLQAWPQASWAGLPYALPTATSGPRLASLLQLVSGR
jgi:subtilisin